MERDVLVVPGRMYGPHVPLLMYAGDAAEARGARVRSMNWPALPPSPNADDAGPWVFGEVAARLDEASLLIGKSMATFATPLAAQRGLPAVWLTPVLTAEWVVDGLRAATAPCLLVGGTADPLWDGALARKLSPHVLEVEGADHGMYVPGPLATSAMILGLVATAVEEFLDDIVWPS